MAVRRLDLIITSNATAALRGFASLEGAAKRMETRFGKAGRTMFNIGVIGAAGFTAFTAKSVQAFIDFDDAMTKSIAIMDDISGPVRKRMEDAAKSVARTTTFSATEAAEAYYGLFSAGLDAEQAISALPVVAEFAQAGLMEMAGATDYLVNAQAALGISMEDPIENMKQMQRVADVLTETNNLATGTVEEFAEALTHKAGGALKAVGKDIEEGAAALAYLAEQGIRGSRAGESLAIFIRDVSRAAGNPAFKDAFAKFGIQVFDSTGNLKNLADVVAEFETALGPMSDKQKATTLEQLGLTRSVGDVIRAMLGGSDAMRGYEMALLNAGGSTQEVADNQMESLRSKIDLIKNRLNVLMIEFGEPIAFWLIEVFFPWFETKFMPALREASSLVRDELSPAFEVMGKALDNPKVVNALVAFTSFVVTMKGADKVFKVVASALGPFAAILAFLANPVKKLGLAFTWVQIKLLPLVPLVKVIAGTIAAVGMTILRFVSQILSPIGLMTIALVAAVVAVIRFRDDIARFFVSAWEAVRDNFIDPIVNFFTGPFIDFWKAVWRAVEGPIRIFLRVVQVAGSIMLALFLAPLIIMTAAVIAILSPIIRWVADNWPKIASFVNTVWDAVVAATRFAWNVVIWPLLKLAWDLISNYVIFNLKLILGVIRTNFNIAKDVITAIWDGIKAVFLASWHFIRDTVIKPLALVWQAVVMPAIQTFVVFMQATWSLIKTGASLAWSWLKTNVLTPFTTFWNAVIAPKISAFVVFMGMVWSNLKTAAGNAWRGIVNVIRHPVNAIIRIINALISGINTVTNLINKIPGVDIPEIPTIPLIGGGGGGTVQNPGEGGALIAGNAMGTYDLSKRGPFRTNGPRAIVGEGDARFPEYVIPTDPRYRGRAHSLFAGLAGELGVKGLQFGGIIDGVGGAISAAISAGGGLLEDIARGALKAAYSPFNEAAKRGLNALPDVLNLRDIAQGVRELIWKIISGADSGFPEVAIGGAAGANAGFIGGGVERWRPTALQALALAGAPASWIGSLLRRMNQESGGNPRAINLWDSNAAKGVPSMGLMQTILPTFNAYAGHLRPRGVWDPLANIFAAIRYTVARYGSGPAGWDRAGGYRGGLRRVPYDDFPANLHKDEMVLRARDADAVRDGGMGTTAVHIGNLNINIDGAGSVDDARRKGRAAGKAFLNVLEERRVLTDARIS